MSKSEQILSHGKGAGFDGRASSARRVAENMMISRWESEGAPQAGGDRRPEHRGTGVAVFPGVPRDGDAVLKIEDLGISLLIAESNLINARVADRLYATRRRKDHEGASRLILGGTRRNVRSVASAQAT
jgi:hypothetical protein